ncbi:hypothetical protein MLD38_035564 [Melastoma candidum]|uniref:Uncharacterized protein n=1 Tax=Melastoma candidum TaxID=119954 RepID=A0ACB9LHE0_9MYRT|nr:hypothetical protein MLD38_035564 [Melastoma candidum]
MRAGGPNSVIQQHPLTPEAAAVVKQAVTLAKNRGNSQVTPLHVAITMLSPNPISIGTCGNVVGILQTACLRSNSHPLRCRALELCLNVALNRLPATPTVQFGEDYYGSTLGGGYPSVSNALVATFKRAHAHQRRGSVENQANSTVAKIELDQLVVSILDDPSVSRVMKEAGFSSSQVKNNVERTIHSDKNSPETNSPSIRNEDVEHVIGNLAQGRRKSLVVIGESLGSVEGIVHKVVERIERGEVPRNLRGLRRLDVSLASFEYLTTDEITRKLKEIKNHAKGGLILQVGGLDKWICHLKDQSPIQHLATEIGRLIHEDREDDYDHRNNIWLIGLATVQQYQQSRNKGDPPLDALWGFHALYIDRRAPEHETDRGIKIKEGGNESCWAHLRPKEPSFDSNEQVERRISGKSSFVNGLPPWLQQYKVETNVNKDYQDCIQVMDECTSSLPFKHPKFMSLPSSPSTNSEFSMVRHRHNHDWPLTNQSRRNFDFPLSNSDPNSTSSSDDVEFVLENASKFMELNDENLQNLCHKLEAELPSYKDVVIPKIASTILQCRSGIVRRKGLTLGRGGGNKNDTWMVFSGADMASKVKMARELARVVFGSRGSFISLSTIEDGGIISKKRPRDGENQGRFERFTEAIHGDPHRVFFLTDMEKADPRSLAGLKKSMETGKVEGLLGGEVSIGDAVVIMSHRGVRLGTRSVTSHSNRAMLDLNRAVEDEDEDDGVDKESVVMDDVGILECVDEVIVFD